MASIDITIQLNYKQYMGIRLFRLVTCLILFLVSCSPVISSTVSPEIPTSGSSVTITLDPISTVLSSEAPVSEVRIINGDNAFFYGDYSLAQTEYTAAFLSTTDPSVQAAALWGLGRANLQAGNYGGALKSFNQLIADFPDSTHRIHSHLLRGEILMALERYSETVEAYTSYISLSPGIIDSYVFGRRADAYTALGMFENAIDDYGSALMSSHIGGDNNLQVKLASAYESLGDSTSALGIYDAIFRDTSDSQVKAQMDLYRGRVYLNLGFTSDAYEFFIHAVDNYPLEYESYSALVALVDAGIPVDDLQRGLVDYYAGQYGYAIDAFTRYASTHPENDGTAYYYEALALRDSGLYQEALDGFSFFIQNFSSNFYWSVAWEDKADLQWYFLGDYEGAVETLLEYTRRTSDLASIPKFLLEAGKISERSGNLADAVDVWESIAEQIPGSELIPQSLFRAGIVNYRMGQYEKALIDFQRCHLLSLTIEDQTRSVFWVGKTHLALGDDASAQASFLQAASIDQTDYYSLRAQDMLFNRAPFSLPALTEFSVDLDAERQLAETWMRVTFDIPPETNLSGLGDLAKDERVIRGNEFYTMDMVTEARLEFEDLHLSISDSALYNYLIGNYFLELGLFNPAIFSLRQVLSLAGMDEQSETLAAPRYFNLVRYGYYYQDLIIPQAISSSIDPLLIFSVIRQESLFDRYAGSGQGALGLMQILPGTAQDTVDSLGWPPNFTTTDLYRPLVNVRLGISYLVDCKMRFSNEIFPALAAYNAGRNEAMIWRDLSGPDPDLFLETIRYPETHGYIRSIYEIYFLYDYFYSKTS